MKGYHILWKDFSPKYLSPQKITFLNLNSYSLPNKIQADWSGSTLAKIKAGQGSASVNFSTPLSRSRITETSSYNIAHSSVLLEIMLSQGKDFPNSSYFYREHYHRIGKKKSHSLSQILNLYNFYVFIFPLSLRISFTKLLILNNIFF